jgi:hypothetical protein
MPEVPEILPKEPEEIVARRETPWRKPLVVGISVAGLFGFVLWGISQFLSLRGVVHVLASRIVLGLTVIAAILMLLILTRSLIKRRNTWFWAGTAIIVFLAVSLDWWAPKPRSTQQTASGNDTLQETMPLPPDAIAAVRTEPKDPTKKKIRQAIGDLIQEGTKIRDKAPVWIGDAPSDVTGEWKSWTKKVQKFLRGNFDSAEVEKFRSLDDPNISLNSKIHAEIAYLEKLLELPDLQP